MLIMLPDISIVFISFRGQRRDRILAVSKSDSSRGIQGYPRASGAAAQSEVFSSEEYFE